jgi:hypothetical protein
VEHADDEDDAFETSEDAASGMPEGEPELTPMGVDLDADEGDPQDEASLPGFPAPGQPDVSG